jgi:hypothetical protein
LDGPSQFEADDGTGIGEVPTAVLAVARCQDLHREACTCNVNRDSSGDALEYARRKSPHSSDACCRHRIEPAVVDSAFMEGRSPLLTEACRAMLGALLLTKLSCVSGPIPLPLSGDAALFMLSHLTHLSINRPMAAS